MRKSSLKAFTPRSQDICRIDEGSTNAYLQHERAIEEFLKGIEPKYNMALAQLRAGEFEREAIYVVAGFTAYVTSCAPAAMRIHEGPLRAVVESTAAILEKNGQIPKSPDILGNKPLTELLADGTVVLEIHGKYPQALGISTIMARVSVFGNSQWEILRNQEMDSPFFTSDYPVALESRGDTGQINWIVPLAPDLAVRIIPDGRLRGTVPDLSFRKFSFRDRRVGRTEVMNINRLLVRSAEDCVFYRDKLDWIPKFIEKNHGYRIESVTARVPSGTGFLNIASQMIVQKLPGDGV